MAGASKFGGTENGADCSKCGGTVAVLFKTRNGTSLLYTVTVNVRIVIAGMVEVVADAGGDEEAEVEAAYLVLQVAQMDYAIHHLRHTEAVAEIVEWIIAVIGLHAELWGEAGGALHEG